MFSSTYFTRTLKQFENAKEIVVIFIDNFAPNINDTLFLFLHVITITPIRFSY